MISLFPLTFHASGKNGTIEFKKYNLNSLSWYFIFMVAFGRFLQMVARQMAYLIYLIEVSGNKYQKATVLKRILQWQ
jgi:hypothetical protein